MRAVGDEAFARFAARLAAVPRTDDPGADLLGLGLAYREHALPDPHFYRVMFGAAGAGAQDGTRGPGHPERDVPGAARRGGRAIVGPTADAEPAAVGLWALVHGLVELELDGSCRATRPRERFAAAPARRRTGHPVGARWHGGRHDESLRVRTRCGATACTPSSSTGRRAPTARPATPTLLDLGVQDTGPDGALWALAVRGVPVTARALAARARARLDRARRPARLPPRRPARRRARAAAVLGGRRGQARAQRGRLRSRPPASRSPRRSRRPRAPCARS